MRNRHTDMTQSAWHRSLWGLFLGPSAVAVCAVIGGNASKPGVGRLTVEHKSACGRPLGGGKLQRQRSVRSVRLFFIDTGCKRPHELTMDSSHHARSSRARARRLSAGV
jgi:hypothetical protein